ncbi:MAG TPA: beta-ketoacyl-[acyl-carrier-protein] synthase family protein, partial [Symbiobacteriaceae bacterium]|nr:beta-ketoacyl-[acyl-carrier-protein] synthase family protein [Symbiobacteriaceae bacterium]
MSDPQKVRVMIAGVGAITSLGPTAGVLWEGVRAGKVAIRAVTGMPMESYRTRIGGEVTPVLPVTLYTPPGRFREPTIDFALKAAEEALAASGLGFDQIPAERWGMVIGSCMGGFPSARRWYAAIQTGENPDPTLLLSFSPQATAEAVSGALGLKGPVFSIATACAAGANAIGYGLDLIRTGQADAVLAGGSDAFSDVLFAGFHCLESLSPEPAAPYSRHRQGLSLGEGSGMLLLVREDLARQFTAPVMAEVLGYGLSADGYHPTAPHPEGEGAGRAIRSALEHAGVAPEQVGYVNGHGTGTPKNDPAETRAIRVALGEAADGVPVSSTKSMIGHLLGAAGAAEAIVTVRALQEQIAPPTASFETNDPECDLDYVPNRARPHAMNVAISNNFAFGGNNACVVFARDGAPIESSASPKREPVVVTGMASLTAAGSDPEALFEAFTAREDCAREADGVRLGRVRDLDPSAFLTPRDRRRMDQLGIFAVTASGLALRDAGLTIGPENRARIGVMFGTGLGPMESLERFFQPVLAEGTAAANPAVFPSTVFNAAAGLVAMHIGVVGPTSTVTVGHAAGAAALAYGFELVASGRADAMVCLAADTLTETVIRGYDMLGMLGNGGRRGGFALAEAGVALVVERLSSARSRGARVYGSVLGYGIASDGLGPGGIRRAPVVD